jgi:hypothetical protein
MFNAVWVSARDWARSAGSGLTEQRLRPAPFLTDFGSASERVRGD